MIDVDWIGPFYDAGGKWYKVPKPPSCFIGEADFVPTGGFPTKRIDNEDGTISYALDYTKPPVVYTKQYVSGPTEETKAIVERDRRIYELEEKLEAYEELRRRFRYLMEGMENYE
jgi:hypothetical protein